MTAVVLSAGGLNRQVTLQTRSSTKDSFGQQVSTWTDWATPRAKIEQLSGRELETAQAINSEITHRVTIRWRDGVTTAMRALYGSRVFNIESVIEPETAHVSLELMCSEGLNQG